MSKLLTVSVAAYNVEAYIREALDSLLSPGTADRLEVLVIDDGGTDGTLAIAREYAEAWPGTVVCIHKDNGGYGSTINCGIENAQGKYFKQLDGDDWYVRENMEDFLDVLEEADSDCVLTFYRRYYEGRRETVTRETFAYLGEGPHVIEETDFREQFGMYSVAYRTDVLKRMPERLTEHCFYTDSEYACYPLPYLRTAWVWHRPVYVYRIGREGASMTPEGVRKHYREHETVFWHAVGVWRRVEGSEVRRRIMGYKLNVGFIEHIRFLLMLPRSGENLGEIRDFCARAERECPEVVRRAVSGSRMLKLLLGSRYLAYPLVRRMIRER